MSVRPPCSRRGISRSTAGGGRVPREEPGFRARFAGTEAIRALDRGSIAEIEMVRIFSLAPGLPGVEPAVATSGGTVENRE
jgi:hypothetical protein